MSSSPRYPVRRIVVRLQVGSHRMAASDDPLFLGLVGPDGREFRLAWRQGRSLRRGSEDIYVLGGRGDAESNVARPELNDPTSPPLDAEKILGAYVRKGLDPIPNVRGHGELDDRVQIERAEVELHAEGLEKPRCFARQGPIWLGLVCGLRSELGPLEDE